MERASARDGPGIGARAARGWDLTPSLKVLAEEPVNERCRWLSGRDARSGAGVGAGDPHPAPPCIPPRPCPGEGLQPRCSHPGWVWGLWGAGTHHHTTPMLRGPLLGEDGGAQAAGGLLRSQPHLQGHAEGSGHLHDPCPTADPAPRAAPGPQQTPSGTGVRGEPRTTPRRGVAPPWGAGWAGGLGQGLRGPRRGLGGGRRDPRRGRHGEAAGKLGKGRRPRGHLR